MIDEIKIIRAVLDGDAESFRNLVHRYEKPVIKMVKNIVDDHHICQDIAQDVFFDAYRKLCSYDSSRSSFSTWLFTIARNKSLNAIKKKRHFSIDNMPEKSSPDCPADTLIRNEFYCRLDEVLGKLPAKHKTAFVLAELEQLPYEQIAQIEGVKLGTVKSRISRAKKKLRAALKKAKGSDI